MSLRLASMSRRSMRLASETSSSAVSSGTLPISLRYMRTGSLVGVLTERSSLGMTSSSGLAPGRRRRHALALEDVDAEVGEEVVDAVDLVGRELDVLQRVGDVVAREVALLAALVDEHADLLDAQLGRLGRLVAVFCERRSRRRPHPSSGSSSTGMARSASRRLRRTRLEPRQLLALLPSLVTPAS